MQLRDVEAGKVGYVTGDALRLLSDDHYSRSTTEYFVDLQAECSAQPDDLHKVPVTVREPVGELLSVAVDLTGQHFGSPCALLTPGTLEADGYRQNARTGARGRWAKAELTGSYVVG